MSGWLARAAVVAASAALLSACSLTGGEPDRTAELRNIAIMPVAYAGPDGGFACDLCDGDVRYSQVTDEDALLVTAFFYEALDRHPRYQVTDWGTVRRLAVAGGVRAAMAELASRHGVDAVLAAELVELREREGTSRAPTKPGGATLRARLVDARTGELLWQDDFNQDETERGRVRRTIGRLVTGEPKRSRSARAIANQGAHRLVGLMVDSQDR